MNVLDKLLNGKILLEGDTTKPVVDNETLNTINAPSFADLLSIKQYAGDGIFYFRNIKQVGCVCRITPISLESSSDDTKDDIFNNITFAMSNSIPNEYKNLWLSQMFIVKNQSSDAVFDSIKKHIKKDCIKREFTQNYLKIVKEHLKDLSSPNGAFIDKNTGQPWALTQLEVYICFWQEADKKPQTIEEEFIKTKEVFERLKSGLEQAKINIKPLDTKEYISFLSLFFHKDKIDYQVDKINGLNVLDKDISELALNKCKIECKKGIWQFKTAKESRYVSYLALEKITKDLNIGHLSAEQKDKLSLVDRMPFGSIWHQTTIHLHTDNSNELLDKIIKQSMGDDDAVIANREVAAEAKAQNADGNFLYRFAAGVYLQSNNEDIDKKIRDIKSSFGANGLELLNPEQNPLTQDDFIKSLPFNFNYKYDQQGFAKRAILTSMSDVCLLSPFYGRSQGTGSAGLLFYNRGGEPLLFDPIADRNMNAFGLIFGPPGSGKSAFLVYYLMQMIAVYNPRIFIIEKGDSFGLMLEHCKSLGLSTHRVAIKPDSKNIQLPPFADAILAINQTNKTDDKSDSDNVKRDILGELMIVAKLMITGGKEDEEKDFKRADENTVIEAIKLAAKTVINKNNKKPMVLTEDVIEALKTLSTDNALNDNEQARIRSMAKSMSSFIDTEFAASMFNTQGKLFPEADITQFDVGVLGNKGYEDKFGVAFISLMNQIVSIAERDQYIGRPIIVLCDEAHVITKNKLMSDYLAVIVLMWRKLNAWLHLSTQSLDHFQSGEIFSIMEWWYCLSMPKAEIDKLAKFIDLTDEQKVLINSAVKKSNQYKEGVVISPSLQTLFRNVTPALPLALAMTGPEEKKQRKVIMTEHNCNELEAAYIMAEAISKSRGGMGL